MVSRWYCDICYYFGDGVLGYFAMTVAGVVVVVIDDCGIVIVVVVVDRSSVVVVISFIDVDRR